MAQDGHRINDEVSYLGCEWLSVPAPLAAPSEAALHRRYGILGGPAAGTRLKGRKHRWLWVRQIAEFSGSDTAFTLFVNLSLTGRIVPFLKLLCD